MKYKSIICQVEHIDGKINGFINDNIIINDIKISTFESKNIIYSVLLIEYKDLKEEYNKIFKESE